MKPEVPIVMPISSDKVEIEWQPVTSSVAVDFYNIQYRRLGRRNRKSTSRWQTLDGVIRDTNSYIITNLEPGELTLLHVLVY